MLNAHDSNPGDRLHRLVKLALDTGEAATLADAERLFAGYRLQLAVGPDAAASATLQAAVLTAVNAGRRCFLGGVRVVGALEVPLAVRWSGCRTLGEAIEYLGGSVGAALAPDMPIVAFGDAALPPRTGTFAVRATFEGWNGGVVPLDDDRRLAERQEFTPAGVLAGALAVSEAFQAARGDVRAGHREVGLSLWQPEATVDWLAGAEPGPTRPRLPARLWLIGLGHLGQAFLWTLGLLPYARPDDMRLVLQDFDTLVDANDSTSLLTTRGIIGEKKTRAMARWCEERGFRTAVVERYFAADFTVAADEPRVALCGVDNVAARAAVEEVGFERVIEAGLGQGVREYLAFQLHTFPAPRNARDRWGGADAGSAPDTLLGRPAYRALAEAGLDECGLTQLAGRTVGAPFVGAVVAALVIAEAVRMAIGAPRYEVIDGSLRALEYRQAIRSVPDPRPFNPGGTEALIAKPLRI